jgi:hypothetical protein
MVVMIIVVKVGDSCDGGNGSDDGGDDSGDGGNGEYDNGDDSVDDELDMVMWWRW